MNNSTVVGVDIGGSHITAAQVNVMTSEVVESTRMRRSINSTQEVSAIIGEWCEVIRDACGLPINASKKIGIAMPGPFDYQNGISFIKGQNKYDLLYGLNIKQLLAASLKLEVENIIFYNDAASFLRGEAYAGAGKSYSRLIGITLGTGLGTSVFYDNHAKDAELWNSPFKESIAEDYLSARWLLKRYAELTGESIPDVKQLASLCDTSNVARDIFNEFGENLGLFLNGFIEFENPEAVILGGNIAKALKLFKESLQASLKIEYQTIPILQAKLGEEAALIGASSLWYA
jgi:glucokinase